MRQQDSEYRALQARLAMIAGQIRPNKVSDGRVVGAMRAVPRECFLPKSLRGIAYLDEDLEVAPGRFLMEPMVFAKLLMEAEIRPTDAVLDIGCITGYSTAVLARLGEAVVGAEETPQLVERAGENLNAQGVDNAVVVQRHLPLGAPEQGPFDVIVLEGAVEVIPETLIEQLAEGGRLVCVRRREGRSSGYLLTKAGGVTGGREVCDAFTPLLAGFAAPRKFRF